VFPVDDIQSRHNMMWPCVVFHQRRNLLQEERRQESTLVEPQEVYLHTVSVSLFGTPSIRGGPRKYLGWTTGGIPPDSFRVTLWDTQYKRGATRVFDTETIRSLGWVWNEMTRAHHHLSKRDVWRVNSRCWPWNNKISGRTLESDDLCTSSPTCLVYIIGYLSEMFDVLIAGVWPWNYKISGWSLESDVSRTSALILTRCLKC
jgi:hypothetical protein